MIIAWNKLTTEKFIEKANIVHSNKYDYSKVVYTVSSSKVIIICSLHGEFEQIANDHLRGFKCPRCSGLKRLTTEEFIKRANEIHNFKYDYSKVQYKNMNSQVIVICKDHGEFYPRTGNHLNAKSGCPSCQSSKGELSIKEYLESNKIEFAQQKWFKDCKNIQTNQYLYFDFYLPTFNLCIEYDGQQHFIPKSFGSDQSSEAKIKNLQTVQYLDSIKTDYCKEKEIKLLRIPYMKLKNINKILEEEIK